MNRKSKIFSTFLVCSMILMPMTHVYATNLAEFDSSLSENSELTTSDSTISTQDTDTEESTSYTTSIEQSSDTQTLSSSVEKSESLESSIDTSTEPSIESRALASDGYYEVSTLSDLKNAISGTDYSKIRVKTNLNITSDIEIKKNVVIDWGGYEHNFNTSHIYVNEIPNTIEFQNFDATASHPGGITASVDTNAIIRCFMTDILSTKYFFQGEFLFTGSLNIYNASKLGLIYAPRATVNLDGVKGSIDLQPVTGQLNSDPGKAYYIRSYRLNVMNGSTLNGVYVGKFYGNLNSSDEQFSGNTSPGLFISGNSNITTNYDRSDHVDSEGQVIDLSIPNATFSIDGPDSSFQANSSIKVDKDDYRGIIRLDGSNSVINVLNGAQLSVSTDTTAGIKLGGNNTQFNVKSGGKLTVNQTNDDNIAANNAIRFLSSGSKLIVDGSDSLIKVTKQGGPASAVRFESGDQAVEVSNGGDFLVESKGDGINVDNGSAMSNSAVQFYGSTGAATFSVKGEDSGITLNSYSGAAIDAMQMDLTFTAAEKTYLEATGNTITTSQMNGVIAAYNLTVDINNPTFFDFTNTQTSGSSGASVFQSRNDIRFALKNSEISLWRKENFKLNNINKSPYFYSLTSDLEILNAGVLASGDEELTNEISAFKPDGYSGITGYNRISANNQQPIIDSLRTPTDADNKIYGHASVPEGLDGSIRDAWDNEVEVKVSVTYADPSKEPKEFVATTQGTTFNGNGTALDPWGEGAEGGLFEVILPDGELLSKGDIVKIVSAHKIGLSENIQQLPDQKVVIDVTPPEPAVVNITKVSTKTRVINGTGEASSKAVLYLDGEILSQTDVGEDGNFELSIPESSLTIGDKLYLVLNDGIGDVSDKGLVVIPETNNGTGNQNPFEKDIEYHDKTFAKGLILSVDGTLSLVVPDKISFEKVIITGLSQEKAGSIEQDQRLEIEDNRETKQPWGLSVSLTKPFTDTQNENIKLDDVLFFSLDGTNYNIVNEQSVSVINGSNQDTNVSDYTNILDDGKAFKLVLNKKNQIVGDFSAELTWTLEDVPTD